MCKYLLSKVLGSDVKEVLARLRVGDSQELEALDMGMEPAEALCLATAQSVESRAVFVDGEPVAISGVTDKGNGVGSPWLVGTDAISEHPEAFKAALVDLVGLYFTLFHRLENVIDVRQSGHIRCLKMLGFTVEEARPFRNGMFHFFHMERQ